MSLSLKEYIKSTLTQIVEANEEFNQTQIDKGADAHTDRRVASSADAMAKMGYITGQNGRTIMPVEFDVATTVEEDDTKTAGGSVRVLGIRAGADGETTLKNISASRICFRIPLTLPITKYE